MDSRIHNTACDFLFGYVCIYGKTTRTYVVGSLIEELLQFRAFVSLMYVAEGVGKLSIWLHKEAKCWRGMEIRVMSCNLVHNNRVTKLWVRPCVCIIILYIVIPLPIVILIAKCYVWIQTSFLVQI